MSIHVFASIVTPYGTAANNRAETEGNITTLQKLIWQGQTHSTVSAEAIRFAFRRLLGSDEKAYGETNRTWNEVVRKNEWKDHTFESGGKKFIDDDLLGYMTADAAKEEGGKGSANVRRAVLEITRAISLTPWYGDVTFNAASPGATPSASKGDDNKSKNPVPYGTEVHATRYQYGFALTPQRLEDKSRAAKGIDALSKLRTVAGNHGRFLFDFSPDSIVIRITDDPAPRLLYCFDPVDGGKNIEAPSLVARVKAGDITPSELVVGGPIVNSDTGNQLRDVGVESIFDGIKQAIKVACARIENHLSVSE